MVTCVHCGCKRQLQGRGLCRKCHDDKSILNLYELMMDYKKRGSGLPLICGQGTTRSLPPEPTSALPGSEEKVLVLKMRAELRLELWHPKDGNQDDD